MNEYYYIIMAVSVLAGLVFKAGQELAGMRSDIKHLTSKVDTMADLPERVAALEVPKKRVHSRR